MIFDEGMKEEFLHKKIEERKQQNAFRQLKLPQDKVDFCSNDYLGIAKNNMLSLSRYLVHANSLKHGSAGSRLLAGNYELIENTENFISLFHNAEAGLIFNSGYDANVGLLSCVPQRGDTILYDYLSHASIRDGIRLSFAQSFSFQHNDLDDLEKKLRAATGNTFVVTESVFSMDGDVAPLAAIGKLCRDHSAHLIVDEAHATGVIGEKGEGVVQQLILEANCFARIHTFGKAVGCHGAIVLGSKTLRNYLINFSRPFIFSTALPEASVAAIKASYELFPQLNNERKQLQKLIQQFQSGESTITNKFKILKSDTPIQVVIIPGNEAVKRVAVFLQKNRLDVRPILYPTVPKGGERLRFALHAYNSVEEVKQVFDLLQSIDLGGAE